MLIVFGTFIMLLAAAYFIGRPLAEDMLRRKLQALVSDHLYARLDMGTLAYRFPYGVVATDVALVTEIPGEASFKLVSADRIDLQLGELPIGDGPLVIQTVDAESPTVHLINTPGGLAGGKLSKPRADPNKPRTKLSEVLRLLHVQLAHGRVQLDDHTVANAAPLVWDQLGINIASRQTPGNAALYQFNFTGNSGKLANLSADGAFDIDTAALHLNGFAIDARLVEGAKQSPLPAEVQAMLNRLGLLGHARLAGAGDLPLGDLPSAALSATLTVDRARGLLPDLGAGELSLQAAVTLGGTVGKGNIEGSLDTLRGRLGATSLDLRPLRFRLGATPDDWNLSQIRLTATYDPPPPHAMLNQPATLDLMADVRRAAGNSIEADLSGTSLALPLSSERLDLAGTVRADRNTLVLQDARIDALGGRVSVQASSLLQNLQTQLIASIAGVDMARARRVIDPAGDGDKITGRLTADASAQMLAAQLPTLTAQGKIAVADGDFGRVPLLARLAKSIGAGENWFVARDASMRFGIERQVVNCHALNVATDALRVTGEGTIDFAKKLDLALHVATNSDWGKAVKKTGIPIVSDLGGLLAGGAQGAIRATTKQFTSFKVTGTLDDPKFNAAPLPVVGWK